MLEGFNDSSFTGDLLIISVGVNTGAETDNVVLNVKQVMLARSRSAVWQQTIVVDQAEN